MDTYSHFQSLPRGRRGDETIVIVPERELAELITKAQESEGSLMARATASYRAEADDWAATDPGRP
jgi:hypothetical protein